MFAMIKSAVADRKGVTALEYALIAAALASITLVGFNGMFTRINTMLSNITF